MAVAMGYIAVGRMHTPANSSRLAARAGRAGARSSLEGAEGPRLNQPNFQP